MPIITRTFVRVSSVLRSRVHRLSSTCGHEMRDYERIAAHLAPYWIQSQTFDILNTCRSGADFRQEAGAHSYAKAHISTQPASSLKDAWLPLADEDQIGSRRTEPSPCDRPQARCRQRRVSRLSLPAVLFRLEQSRTARSFRPESFPLCHERTFQS